MNKNLLKGLMFGFIGAIPLNALLLIVFAVLQNMGIINDAGNNPLLILGIYAITFLVYILTVRAYFQKASSDRLKKLKREVSAVTGRRL